MISSVRAQLPLAESPLPPGSYEPRPGGQYPTGTAAPVSGTLQAGAVQQSPPKLDAGNRQLIEARMATENEAAAVAEAARNAYIKASIAAGMSPLPLP